MLHCLIAKKAAYKPFSSLDDLDAQTAPVSRVPHMACYSIIDWEDSRVTDNQEDSLRVAESDIFQKVN